MAAASTFLENCRWNFSRTFNLLSVDLNFDLSTLSALKTFYYYKKEKAYKVFWDCAIGCCSPRIAWWVAIYHQVDCPSSPVVVNFQVQSVEK